MNKLLFPFVRMAATVTIFMVVSLPSLADIYDPQNYPGYYDLKGMKLSRPPRKGACIIRFKDGSSRLANL